MAVINLTPDSFYEESRVSDTQNFFKKIERAVSEGADWLDLGAVSTRPGSMHVDLDEERRRLMGFLDLVVRHFPGVPISVDTYRAEIAMEAVERGAQIINDVSFGSEPGLLAFCAKNDVPYVLMHLRGTPNDMMQNTDYSNVIQDVIDELQVKIDQLEKLGLKNLIVDPGFGFSKTLEQNYLLMKELEQFHDLNKPLLVGVSRKSMIYKLLETSPDASLNGSTVLHTVALLKGTSILRVHDVKEAVECRKLIQMLKSAG